MILTGDVLLNIIKALQKIRKKDGLIIRRQGNMIQYNIPGTKREHWWTFVIKELDSDVYVSVMYYIGKDKPRTTVPFKTYKYRFEDGSGELAEKTLTAEIDRLYELVTNKYRLNKFIYDGFDKDDIRMIMLLHSLPQKSS